jgi:hypothetical protein
MTLRLAFTAMVLVFLLSGCGGGVTPQQPAAPPPPAATGPALPESFILSAAPADAKDVSALKKDSKVGDEVVIRGQVGGSKAPIVEQRAIMTIVDMKLPACNVKPDDDCKTPWDFCCETPESLKANTASIQFSGTDGKPLRVDLRSVSGLNNLAVVVVKGKVVSREKDNLFINASGIYIEKKGMLAK